MTHTSRTVGFKRGERNVFFHILTACNLSCRHCYINRDQHGTEMLDRSRIEQWLTLFADAGKQANLIILGGEPTLHPELPFAVKKAKALGYSVTVDTNGYLFHDFLGRVTPRELDYLSFSLDGPDSEINDAIRGGGVFEVCTAGIKRAVKAGFKVSLIYTVSEKNLNALPRMIPLLERLGVRRWFIQVLGLRGNSAAGEGGETSRVSRRRWLETVPEVAAKAAQAGLYVVYPQVFLEPAEEFFCAGNVAENFFIFPNGRVYRCPLCEDYPLNAYRIRDGKLERTPGLNEDRFFALEIAEGCVMNKLLQPDTLEYDADGRPKYQISCCLLKREIGYGR
jgi:MoaA/NifB/PqqE/SkfB family radical SAM enzyme